MKKCITIILLAFSCILQAQYTRWPETQFSPQDTANHNLNVLYVSAALSPFLIGARYDRYFDYTGAYIGINTGKISGGSFYMNRQVRFSAGFILKLEYIVDQIDSPIITFGGAYQHWMSKDYYPGYIDPEDAFKSFAFDFGVGGRIKRFNFAGRVDMSNFNFLFDIGYNF